MFLNRLLSMNAGDPHLTLALSPPIGWERRGDALRRDREQADAGRVLEGSAISKSQVAGQTDVPCQSGVALRLPPHSKTLPEDLRFMIYDLRLMGPCF